MRRVCEACGSEIDNDFNYCRECGEIVEPLEEVEEDLTVVEKKMKDFEFILSLSRKEK